MDLVEMPFMRFPAHADRSRASTRSSRSTRRFGIVPVAIPPIIPDVPNPLEEMPQPDRHRPRLPQAAGRRLRLRVLRRAGAAPGTSIAYFGPDVRIPVPQPALNVNMDAHTNVESLSFSLDGTGQEDRRLTVIDPITRQHADPDPGAEPQHPAAAAGRAADAAGEGRVPRAMATRLAPDAGAQHGARHRASARRTRSPARARSTCCATAACCARACWSACAARASPTTASTTSTASPTTSSAASTSRASAVARRPHLQHPGGAA